MQEDHLHYTRCTHQLMEKERFIQVHKFVKSMKRLQTYPGITLTMSKWLMEGEKSIVENYGTPTSVEEDSLLQALMSQVSLGEETLLKGMIVKQWMSAQMQWCRHNNMRCDGKWWKMNVIKALQNFTFSMWTKRNQILHGDEDTEILELKKSKCHKQIKQLFKKSRRNLNFDEKKLFKLPLVYRMKGLVAGMLLWIERVELIFQNKDQDEDNNLTTKYWWYKQTKKWRQMSTVVT